MVLWVIRESFDSGATRVTANDTHLQIRGWEVGSFSYFSGAELNGPVYTGTITLTLKLEESGWMVVDLIPEARRQ